MKGLITKDLLHLRCNFLPMYAYTVFMLGLCSAVTLTKGEIKFAYVPTIAVFPSVVVISMMLDDLRTGYSKTECFLPVTMKQRVCAKYIFTFINAFSIGLIFMITQGICALLVGGKLFDALGGCTLIIASTMLYPLLTLPFIYAFGLKHTKKVLAFSLLALTVLWVFSIFLMKRDSVLGPVICIKVFGAIVLLAAVSLAVSLCVCEKKEPE